jgi:hypothetical protein
MLITGIFRAYIDVFEANNAITDQIITGIALVVFEGEGSGLTFLLYCRVNIKMSSLTLL